MSRFTLRRFASYFFRGLLFVAPLSLTLYIIFEILQWIDGIINVEIPGLGILIIIGIITFLGYFTSFFITRPIFEQVERYLVKVPLVNILYTSFKDLIGAFVGDQKKFNAPVTVVFDEKGEVLKVGFITIEDLKIIGLPGYTSVYFPHSYNFSGNHFLVKNNRVTPLNIGSSDAMKFVVSGGISGLEGEKK